MNRILSGGKPVLLMSFLCLSMASFAFGQENPAPPSNQNNQNSQGNQSNLPPVVDRSAPPQPQNSANPANGQPKPANGSVPTAGGAPVDSNTYKIGPSDVLLINVWDESRFSGNFSVHQDGKFTLPLVGDLEAGGKTPHEVQEIVTQALQKYVVRPLVTVYVQEVGSKRYFIDGEIARPGEYALVVPTTIFEAISKAGGPQEFANTKHIYVLRGTQRLYFNYKDVLKGKHMDENILLQPGDHIVVP